MHKHARLTSPDSIPADRTSSFFEGKREVCRKSDPTGPFPARQAVCRPARICLYDKLRSCPVRLEQKFPGPYRSIRELSLSSLVGLDITAPTYVVGSRDRSLRRLWRLRIVCRTALSARCRAAIVSRSPHRPFATTRRSCQEMTPYELRRPHQG